MDTRLKARLSFFIYITVLAVSDTRFSYMILNMFLAFAALEISFLLPLFKVNSKREIFVSTFFYGVFILLAPNVFYVVTDLIHLNGYRFDYLNGLVIAEWCDFFILTSGVLLAIYYFILMLEQIESLPQEIRWKDVCIGAFIILSSIGVFIGRFLRFHSIHLFTDPISVMKLFTNSLNEGALLFICGISLLQFIIYWLFRDLKRVEGV
ncbi:DUF1361 domain-containing protein [Bacillus toyonensis]|uniref:DUF1361 domain-containing protein n=1 Tax=Bacillus toyonensis TaxID=155322 RepID=UPI002E2351C1|nr:DUF1361 domain-containing protein [Bacillus toyonensis]